MADSNWKKSLKTFDDRRNIIVPGDDKTTVQFCIEQFLELAEEAIDDHQYFAVALSGGSTPKAIFQGILEHKKHLKVDWSRVLLFWGDERCVPLDHPESNYRMAMEAFSKLPIPTENIFPMPVEGDLKHDAKAYEEIIQNKISGVFDLVMLGMGEDGHTASLFPKTAALHEEKILVAENYIPGKNTWRMTLTYPCINAARNTIVYVLGKNKAQMVNKVFSDPYQPDILPIQKIGTTSHPVLWVMDSEAAAELPQT